MEAYYRIISGNKGIYEAVDIDCPKNDERRKNKPDGSWLKKIGLSYPKAISLWTEKGMKQYISSGLFKWHISVVKKQSYVLVCNEPKEKLYSDENQVICSPENLDITQKIPAKEFIKLS